jgi:hypothetical protein
MMTPLFTATEWAFGLFWCLFLSHFWLFRFFLSLNRLDLNHFRLLHFYFLNWKHF